MHRTHNTCNISNNNNNNTILLHLQNQCTYYTADDKSVDSITIQHSITNARQKEMRSGSHVNHGYSDEFLDSDRVANVYFTSDVDAKSRISSLNDFYRINLNDVRRAGAHDDGVFNECKISDQESDDDIASM